MARPFRDRLPILILSLLASALVAGSAFAAPEGKTGEIGFEVRLEPADLGPGGEGVLVVTSVIEDELHLYVDGDEAVRWKPIPVPGVTYHSPYGKSWTNWELLAQKPGRVTWSKPTMRAVPGFPNAPPDPVWEEGHDFEIRIPVTLSDEVAEDAELGIVVDYSACDERSCFDRIKGARAVVKLGAVTVDPVTADPVTADPVAADPVAVKPIYHPFPQSDAASVTLEIQDGPVAVVTFTPAFGYYIHGPDAMEPDPPLTVEPLEDEGIAWGDWDFDEADEKLKTPYAVRIPFQRDGAKQLRVRVGWQGCDEVGTCDRPQTHVLVARWKAASDDPEVPLVHPDETNGAEPPPPPAPAPVEVQPGEKVLVKPSEALPFPVVHGDDLDEPRTDDDWRVVEAGAFHAAKPGSDLQTKWKSSWILFLGTIFLFGIGLAFTPCVLPIIPLTISVIGGGNPDIRKSRLTLLLSVYVLGLTLTYGAAGAAAGLLGEAINLEAAFQNPIAVWIIALIFFAMAAGMMGFFELQPPAWMERMRGGAQKKSGTIVGSFLLGILAAVIASPCTGPFVVGMIAAVAVAQDPMLGFLWFSTLGLGMGAVFFAAGSLNLLARPGPWMVWVRYFFGVLLFGVALYLVANAGLIDDVFVLFGAGFAVAIFAWWAVARHLHRKEGERIEVARTRGAILAVCIVITTGAVAFLTRPATGGPEGWIKVRDVAHMKEEVDRAVKEGKPVVVDVWATWCTYCKAYDGVIADDAYLREAFDGMVRIKIDVKEDARVDLRRAVGLPDGGQPKMVFFDEKGRIRRAADIQQWEGSDSGAELKKRVDFVYGRTGSSNARAGE